MTFIDLVKKRYSVRDYLETPLADSLIESVLEASRFAPSACNKQPWAFIVVRDPDSKKRLESVYPRPWFLQAPVIIAVCCDRNATWRRADGKDFGDIDIAIALDHMTLAAAEAGLGTCWIGNFNAAEAKRVLKLPQNIEPVAFPGPQAINKKSRKEMRDIVSWGFYGGKRP